MKRTAQFLILLILLATNSKAQQMMRHSGGNKQQTNKTVVSKTIIDNVFKEYKFSEALSLLQKELSLQIKLKQPTEKTEELISKARLGLNMLQGTEKIQVIDSFVVKKDSFLNSYKLSKENGHIKTFNQFLSYTNYVLKGGKSSYINELGDAAFLSIANNHNNYLLHRSDKIEDNWKIPKPLKGIDSCYLNQDFPFVMTDGTTLYFAAQGENSLGGYDIFVTRFNPETREYLKPENIGMPYNSPYNDYMYAIDEANNLGWFASDRFQDKNHVCIYVFIPNVARDVYDWNADDELLIRKAAALKQIAITQTDTSQISIAISKLKQLQSINSENTNESSFICIIDDKHIYHSLDDFKQNSAKTLASQWITKTLKAKSIKGKLDKYHQIYMKAEGDKRKLLTSTILQEEKIYRQLLLEAEELLKRIRTVELLNKK